MKTRIVTYILTGIVGLLTVVLSGSCDNSDLIRRVDPQLEIQDDVFIGPSASREVLNLHSTYPWFAEASDGWIKLLRYRGQALKPDSIVAMIEENPNMEPREGWIEIRLMDQMSKRITVKQNGRGSLITLSKNLIYFNVKGGEVILDVYTDLEWDTDVKQADGFTFTKVDKNHLKVKADLNTTGAERKKTVTLTDTGNTVNAKLEVVQTNVEKMLSIPWTKEAKDMLIPKTGQALEIPVSLNIQYDCVVSDNSWIKINDTPTFSGDIVQDIIVKATVEPNTTGEERTGYIVVKDKVVDSKVTDTLYISQRAKSQIIYVKAGSIGDGTSWERAFGSIVEGMAACTANGDMELWVAEGNYQLLAQFVWKPVNVYGGFKGTETKLKERDLRRKSTILGGKFITMSAYGNKINNDWYYMDGFIFTGANNEDTYMGTLEIYKCQALRNCIIHGNTYGKNAGGYFDNTRLINCVFYNNTTTITSSVVQAFSTELYNVTIVNNTGKGSGGGIRINGTNSALYNTVVWGNVHATGTTHQVYLDANGNSKFVNSAVQGGFVFNGNNKPSSINGCIALNANNAAADGPLFIDPAGRNYQLQSNSPLIDAGANQPLKNLNLLNDLIGAKRIWGVNSDIGAFEYIGQN